MEEQDNLEEVKILSTRNQIESFKESLVWKDMIRELMAWDKGFEMELNSLSGNAATENSSTASVLIHLGFIDGVRKAVVYFLTLPDTLLDSLKEEKDVPGRDSAG